MLKRFVPLLALVFALPAQAAMNLRHVTLVWDGANAQVLVVPHGARVVPVARRPGRTVPGWVRASGAIAGINGGYFNHSDGWPVSHVLADGRALTDPEHNRALCDNPQLRPLLPTIFNARAEWRASDGGSWTIAPHAAPAEGRLIDALQAGPTLLPSPDLEREGFVQRDARGRVVRDGIGSLTRAARSALGLTSTGDMLLVAVGGRGLTIAQLSGLMTHLGAVRAMALDGGSSTTLVWRDGARDTCFVGSGRAPAVVNSALVVEP
ncbi:MAG TPA: phosphodiester glycosidase family protein [Oscillatoriaceae cyanobacterium]